MFEEWRSMARRAARRTADFAVTTPLVRWTWTGLADESYAAVLPEFRPLDRETVREMIAGRYLLASKLVDTQGASPFSVDVDHQEWFCELHGFSWLRHFRDVRDEGERRFARTLVLDWIGRNGRFEARSWTPSLTAVRVLNWLRHFNLLVEGASDEQEKTISRVLGTQVQSLKVRGSTTADPVDRLLTAIALVGCALSEDDGEGGLEKRIRRLHGLLERNLDADGLHRSRNPRVQLQLLAELVPIRQVLSQRNPAQARTLGQAMDRMHLSLDMLTLGTGEPAYVNGCGQLPVEEMIAVQSQSPQRRRGSATVSGYGVLVEGESVVVADSGLVPEPSFALGAHAGALAFEFSHGRDLVVGNCGPAPAGYDDGRLMFRQSVAHSSPTIDDKSSARIVRIGPATGIAVAIDPAPTIRLDADEPALSLSTTAYQARFGMTIERRLSLISGGRTLVGQDRMLAEPGTKVSGRCIIRFHLAPGARAEQNAEEAVVRIRLQSGSEWTFLWEGTSARLEDSVRHSAYFGLYRTQQIVLEAEAAPGREFAWIFTRQQD